MVSLTEGLISQKKQKQGQRRNEQNPERQQETEPEPEIGIIGERVKPPANHRRANLPSNQASGKSPSLIRNAVSRREKSREDLCLSWWHKKGLPNPRGLVLYALSFSSFVRSDPIRFHNPYSSLQKRVRKGNIIHR